MGSVPTTEQIYRQECFRSLASSPIALQRSPPPWGRDLVTTTGQATTMDKHVGVSNEPSPEAVEQRRESLANTEKPF